MAAAWLTTGWGLYVSAFMMYVGWWLIPLLLLFWYRSRLAKFPIDVVIYEKRGNAIIKSNDRAGRFNDPIVEYKFKLAKDTIPIPDYDWVLQCLHRPATVFEKFTNMLAGTIGSITVFKYSSKQYKPIKVQINGEYKLKYQPIKGKDGQPVYVQMYVPVNPTKALSMLDFEVIDWDDINHMTQELRAIQMRRSPVQDWIQKWWPIMAVVLGIMALIIAGYYYKDIVTSAHCSAAPAAAQQQQIATAPNIPVISGVVTPGQ